MKETLNQARKGTRALLLCLALLVAPLTAGTCEGEEVSLAWACVGESWAALTCPQLDAASNLPVYDFSTPGVNIKGLIMNIDTVKASLQSIPEDNVLVWLSTGTLYPDIFKFQLGQSAYDAYGPDVVGGYAIATYIRELSASRPGLVFLIARHNFDINGPNGFWSDAALDWVPLPQNSIMLDFSCFDEVVVFVDGLHIRPEDFKLRVDYVQGQANCPTN